MCNMFAAIAELASIGVLLTGVIGISRARDYSSCVWCSATTLLRSNWMALASNAALFLLLVTTGAGPLAASGQLLISVVPLLAIHSLRSKIRADQARDALTPSDGADGYWFKT